MAIIEEKSYTTKREKILQHLLLQCTKSGEGCTLKEISSAVGLSMAGARHYMVILEKEGLIDLEEKSGMTGRPALLYCLNERAVNFFPKEYAEFGVDLLEELKEKYGVEEIQNILDNIGKKQAARIAKEMEIDIHNGTSLHSQKMLLEKLIEIFQNRGKYPKLSEDDTSFLVRNYNCLYYNIAKEDNLVCRVHETLMSNLTNNRSYKDKCILDGDKYCQFKIEKYKE